MKRSILLLMAIAVALIFFGCEKETFAPETNPIDQETAAFKAAKEKVSFEGISFPAEVPGPYDTEGDITEYLNGKYQTKWKDVIVTWYDDADDWRVTGTTVWYANYYWEGEAPWSNGKVWGKTELFVDYNPDFTSDDPGMWEISWHGYITDGGWKAYVDAVGTGKSGDVKGLVAHWKYTLDLAADGFEYKTKGTIH